MNEKFEKYHAENPQIYREFERKTLFAISRGFRHYGAKAIFEIVRFETGIFAHKGFKVDNTFTPDYARLFEQNHPEHAGFFEKRERKKVA